MIPRKLFPSAANPSSPPTKTDDTDVAPPLARRSAALAGDGCPSSSGLLGRRGAVGIAAVALTVWHRPIIRSVVLPAHAVTSEPVLFAIFAIARTDTGLFVAFDSNASDKVTLSVASIPASEPSNDISARFEPPVRSLMIAPPLNVFPGHIYKVTAQQSGLARTTRLSVMASADFSMSATRLSLRASRIKARITLSEAVRGDERCMVSIEFRTKQDTLVGRETVQMTVTNSRVMVNIATTTLSFTPPQNGSLRLSARMRRRNIFGPATATATTSF